VDLDWFCGLCAAAGSETNAIAASNESAKRKSKRNFNIIAIPPGVMSYFFAPVGKRNVIDARILQSAVPGSRAARPRNRRLVSPTVCHSAAHHTMNKSPNLDEDRV
jgi:hypothetical protein